MTKPFKVEVTQTVIREFSVDANSPEEAESIALEYMSDGEPGLVMDTSIEDTEVYPYDETLAE